MLAEFEHRLHWILTQRAPLLRVFAWQLVPDLVELVVAGDEEFLRLLLPCLLLLQLALKVRMLFFETLEVKHSLLLRLAVRINSGLERLQLGLLLTQFLPIKIGFLFKLSGSLSVFRHFFG